MINYDDLLIIISEMNMLSQAKKRDVLVIAIGKYSKHSKLQICQQKYDY